MLQCRNRPSHTPVRKLPLAGRARPLAARLGNELSVRPTAPRPAAHGLRRAAHAAWCLWPGFYPSAFPSVAPLRDFLEFSALSH